MSFRQFMVCVTIGPLCAIWFVGLLGGSPMLAVMGWLLGDRAPVKNTWEMISEAPVGMFKDCYRGIGGE